MDGRTGTVTRLASRSGDGGVTRRGVMLAVLTALLAGCGVTPQSGHYRFRMIVEVRTPQGVTRGSGVYSVSAATTGEILPEAAKRILALRGEAIALDLPGGPVFALLRTKGANPDVDLAVASMAALDPAFNYDWVASAARIGARWTKAKADLPRDKWPMFVRFRDLRDPKSVEAVAPQAIGVRRIIVETTSDAVTLGIQDRLSWLRTHNGALDYDGRMHPEHPEKDVNQRAFSTELGK